MMAYLEWWLLEQWIPDRGWRRVPPIFWQYCRVRGLLIDRISYELCLRKLNISEFRDFQYSNEKQKYSKLETRPLACDRVLKNNYFRRLPLPIILNHFNQSGTVSREGELDTNNIGLLLSMETGEMDRKEPIQLTETGFFTTWTEQFRRSNLERCRLCWS